MTRKREITLHMEKSTSISKRTRSNGMGTDVESTFTRLSANFVTKDSTIPLQGGRCVGQSGTWDNGMGTGVETGDSAAHEGTCCD